MASYLRRVFGGGRDEPSAAGPGAATPVTPGKPPQLGLLRRGDGPRRVAIFLDASRESEFASKWAIENVVDKQRDRVMLLSVATPPPFADAIAPAADVDVPLETPREREARLREETDAAVRFAKELLDVAAKDGAARGVKRIETEVVMGTSASLVGPLLCEAATARDADVTVIGARGRGMLKCVRHALHAQSKGPGCCSNADANSRPRAQEPAQLGGSGQHKRVRGETFGHAAPYRTPQAT